MARDDDDCGGGDAGDDLRSLSAVCHVQEWQGETMSLWFKFFGFQIVIRVLNLFYSQIESHQAQTEQPVSTP